MARLGTDLNWWLDQASERSYATKCDRSLLDPRQLAHLAQTLEAYRPYDYQPAHFEAAFQVFAVESEIADDRLRLAPADESVFNTAAPFFAVPLIHDEGTGPYYDFLDAITAARIRLLNATHDYARPCTEWEMIEELDALDNDRYFNADTIHAFDEITEILQWSPAEWEGS